MTHIVVCGYPRSGTTLLYNMLRHGVAEYRFFDRETRALDALGNSPRITKRPADAFEAGRIARATGARFIAVVRDPRAVLCSVHANSRGRYKVNWNFSWRTAARRGIVGRHQGLIQWDIALHAIPGAVTVRYEDLVADPSGQQARLEQEFGFVRAGPFADFHRADIPPRLAHQLNGVRPVEASRLAAWRCHPERIREQFFACPALFDLLIARGYEKDRTWFSNL